MAQIQYATRGRTHQASHSAGATTQSRAAPLASGTAQQQPRAASGPRAQAFGAGGAQAQGFSQGGVRQQGQQPGSQYGHAFSPADRGQVPFSPASLAQRSSPPPQVASNLQHFNNNQFPFSGQGKVSSPASSVATTVTRSSTPGRIEAPLSSCRRATDQPSRNPLTSPDASRQTPGSSQASPANLMNRYADMQHTPPGNAPSGTNENLTKGSSMLSGSASGRATNMDRVQRTPEGPSPATQLRLPLDSSAARDVTNNARDNLVRNGSSTNREEAKTPPDGRILAPSFCTVRGGQGPRTASAVRSPARQVIPGISPPKVVSSSAVNANEQFACLMQECTKVGPKVGDKLLDAPTILGRDLTVAAANDGTEEQEDETHQFFCQNIGKIRRSCVQWLFQTIVSGTPDAPPSRMAVEIAVDDIMAQCQYHETHLVFALKLLQRYAQKKKWDTLLNADYIRWRQEWKKNLRVALHTAEGCQPFVNDGPLKGEHVVKAADGLLGELGDKRLWDGQWELGKTLGWRLHVSGDEFTHFTNEMLQMNQRDQVQKFSLKGQRGHSPSLQGNAANKHNRSAPNGRGDNMLTSKSSPEFPAGPAKRQEMLSPKRETDDHKKGGEDDPHIDSVKNGIMSAGVLQQQQPPRGGPGQPSKYQTRATVGNPSGVGDRPGPRGGVDAVRNGFINKQPQIPQTGQDRGRTGIDGKADGPTRPAAPDRLPDSRPFVQRTEAGVPPPVSSRLSAYQGSAMDDRSGNREANRGSNGISGTNTSRTAAQASSVPLRTNTTAGSAATGSQRRELSGPAGSSMAGIARTPTSHTPRHNLAVTGLKPSPSGPGAAPPVQNPAMNMSAFPQQQRCNIGARGVMQPGQLRR